MRGKTLHLVLAFMIFCMVISLGETSWFKSSPGIQKPGVGSKRRPPSKDSSEDKDDIEAEAFISTLFEGRYTDEERLTLAQGAGLHVILLHQGALQTYEKKQDECFSNAAAILRTGCQQIKLEDGAKIQYAIRLTKCEVSTANMAIPVECAGDPISIIPLDATVDVIQWIFPRMSMCFAVRYEIERGLVEELYRNLTRGQVASYRLLRRQQREMREWHNEEVAQMEALKETQMGIASMAAHIENTTTLAASLAASLRTDVTFALLRLSDLMTGQNATRDAVEHVLSRTKELSKDVLQGFEATLSSIAVMGHDLDGIATNMTRVVEAQKEAHEAIVQIQETTKLTVDRVMSRSETVLNSLDRVDSQVASSDEKLRLFAARHSEMLMTLMLATQQMHQAQAELFNATAEALVQLNATAHDGVRLQQTVQASFESFRNEHTRLAQSWSESFARAQSDLDRLSERSTRQVALLTEAAEAASLRHAEIVMVLKPVAWVVGILYGV
ncbi:hypothetical protein HK104_010724 [Borealophlyctis nickersoniae]|nr:hypothetical protein HK104_010724 [Borealophlyctis nickersoniae]